MDEGGGRREWMKEGEEGRVRWGGGKSKMGRREE